MHKTYKNKEQLLKELDEMRQRIVEMENSQTQFRQDEERLRHLASFPNLNPNPVLEVNSSGEITFFNNATVKVLEDLGIDKGNIHALLPDSLMISLRNWDKKYRQIVSCEITIKDRIFNEIINFTPLYRAAHIYITDITERKRMEAALLDSESRFRRLAENARDIIFRMSLPDGRYEYVSPAAFDISGFTPKEYYDGTCDLQKIIHPDFVDYLNYHWNNLLQGKEVPSSYEFKIIHKKGGERWLHQRNVPVYNENGSLIALEGIATEITDLKRAEEEVKKHSDRLEELVMERTAELERKSKTVEELNVELKVLLRQVQQDKENLEQRLVLNVKKLVIPYLEKIRKINADNQQHSYLSIIEANLNEIISPFLHTIHQFNLTHRETQVANLVREGKTTKEIATIIGVATNAIDSYRNSIRTKLGLNKKKVNLQSYLKSLK